MNKEFRLNTAQLRSVLNPARLQIDLMSRGTGKSTSIGFKVQQLAHDCPRSKNLFVGRTFAQLQQRTLPPVMAELERLGYKKDVHYWLGKRPDKRLNIPEPHEPLLHYENTMVWYTGTVFMLVSQDRPGLARGINADAAIADEAITLKRDHIDQEILPSIRANLGKYKSPIHHSVHFLSSKPIGHAGAWLLDYGKYYEEDGMNYQEKQRALVQVMIEFLNVKADNRAQMQKCWDEIRVLTMALKRYVKITPQGSIFYNEGHVFENIHNLGIAYVKNLQRTMTEISFLVEVLNLTMTKIDGGFYASFDEDTHCDEWFDYGFLDKYNYDWATIKAMNDCRADNYLKNDRLFIGCDYNSAINTVVVGQPGLGNEIRILNAIYVETPLLSQHCAQAFCDYYAHHNEKKVTFFYNHTAIPKDASRGYTHASEWVRILRKNKWQVTEKYLGQEKSHDWRYQHFNKMFREEEPTYPRVRFFKSRCEPLLRSLMLAQTKQGPSGFEKDKSSEKSKIIKPVDATHFSEAFDTLIHGFLDIKKSQSVYVPIAS
jgi:hypothetical protein